MIYIFRVVCRLLHGKHTKCSLDRMTEIITTVGYPEVKRNNNQQ